MEGNAMDLWNEFCILVDEHKRKKVSEQKFQKLVIDLFAELGWSGIKKEIVTQESIPIGSANSLIPDIIIKSKNRNLFVVELKKPSITAIDQYDKQLASYMLQLQLCFGLYIGEVIHVLFNNPMDFDPPKRVATIEFAPDNPDGNELLSIISKAGFSENAMILYCERKLKETTIEKVAIEPVNHRKKADKQTGKKNDLFSNQLAQNMYTWLEEWEQKCLIRFDRRHNKGFFTFYTPLLDRLLPPYDGKSSYYYFFYYKSGQNPYMFLELTNHGMPKSILCKANKLTELFNKKPMTDDDTYRRLVRWNLNDSLVGSDADFLDSFLSLKPALNKIITKDIPVIEKRIQEALKTI